MNTIDLMNGIGVMDGTGPGVFLGAGLTWFVLSVALYVWTALALAAVFRKSGEEPWKGWVPFYNLFTLFQLAGLSGWLVLVVLVPVLGQVALWVVTIVACHRLNASFGFGAGMTVLAALLFPVWASVVGWGSARWVGADAPAGPHRTGEGPVLVDRRPPAPAPAWGPPPSPTSATAGRDVGLDDDLDGDRPLPAWAVPASGSPLRTFPRGEVDEGGASELTGEVTGAVPGAPGPISAVPVQTRDASPPVSPLPPVTRVPAAPLPTDRESWGPVLSPMADPDGFPEASGEVSAVAGAPDAGGPRSARSTIVAQSEFAGVPESPVEETVIARRRRTGWTLTPVGGLPVALTSDMVIVGRRPSADPDFPEAQRITVVDETRTMSKTHARLELRGDFWAVLDLDSTNGVVLIGDDGAETELQPGVLSRVGSRFLLGDAELRLAPDAPS